MIVPRRGLAAISVLLAVLFLDGTASALRRTGIFLLHGKGSARLQYPDEAFAYWGYDMINRITNLQTIPYAIGHYDGTKSPMYAALPVARQIVDFIQTRGITDLVVVTHSYGATVLRSIVSRPDQYLYTPGPGDPPLEQWRYDISNQRHLIIDRLRVTWLIAGPNGGSEAADLAYANTSFRQSLTDYLALLLGQRTAATSYCTTRAMSRLNRIALLGTPGRPPLPGIWHPIVGTSALSDGRHAADFELVALARLSGMPTPNDGAVAAWSAGLVGQGFYLGSCGGACAPQYFKYTAANHDHSRRYEYRGDWIDRRIAEWIAYFTATGRLR